MTNEELRVLKRNSARIRACLLRVLKQKKGGHLGGSLSIVEALSVLYTRYMRYDPADPQNPDRDYLVLSKGCLLYTSRLCSDDIAGCHDHLLFDL